MAAAAGVGVSHGGGWVGPAAVAVLVCGRGEAGWPRPGPGGGELAPGAYPGSGRPSARR